MKRRFTYNPQIKGQVLVTDRDAILTTVFGQAEDGVHTADAKPVYIDELIDFIVRNEYAGFLLDASVGYDMPSERVEVDFSTDGQVSFKKLISSIYIHDSAVVPPTQVFVTAYAVYENERVVFKPTSIAYTTNFPYPIYLN